MRRRDDDAHIKQLEYLCEQAEQLRKTAEQLCAELTKRIRASRDETPRINSRPERRRTRRQS